MAWARGKKEKKIVISADGACMVDEWDKGLTIFIQIVEIMTDSDSEDEVVAAKPRPKPIPRNRQVAAPAPASEVAKPQQAKVKKESKAAKVKGDTPILPVVTSNSNVVPSTSASLDDNLPQFARSAWSSEFLPTLYAFLGSLEKPWELSDPKETDNVKTIQMLIDIVYPGSKYEVKLNDRIYLMVNYAITVDNRCLTVNSLTGEGPH